MAINIPCPEGHFCRKSPRYYFILQLAEFHLVAIHENLSRVSHSNLTQLVTWHKFNHHQTGNNLTFNHNLRERQREQEQRGPLATTGSHEQKRGAMMSTRIHYRRQGATTEDQGAATEHGGLPVKMGGHQRQRGSTTDDGDHWRQLGVMSNDWEQRATTGTTTRATATEECENDIENP